MKALLALVAVLAALATAGTASADRFIPDTLAPGGPTGGHSWSTQAYQFVTDTLAPGGGPEVAPAASSSNSFSWSDAGIGAAATAGTLFVVLGVALVVMRRQTRFAS